MEFIGRKDELAFLESCYRSTKAQLVFVYGRRRVGKTEVLKEFCKGKEHVFFAAQEATGAEQLRAFSQRLFDGGAEAARYARSYQTWEDAFSDIPKLPFSHKKLVVIDEFPYLVRGNASIPSVLQNLWDHLLKDEDVMVVLCGSAMSFIEKELLSEKNPLFGRATGVLKMQAMPYWDAARFFPHYSPLEKMLAFAVLGGIPHYLAQFDAGLPVAENIKQTLLHKGTVLYSEVEFLMRQEFRETATYNSIIQAVALGATRLNEIAQVSLIDAHKASVYLAHLVEVGIVEREFSVDEGMKVRSKGQRGLYRIADNYFRFWYAFVFSNRSDLELFDVEGVYRHEVAPALGGFASWPFERVCLAWLRRQNIEGGLPFRLARSGRWWNKETELDVLGTDRDSAHLLLGECKFTNAKVGMREKVALAAKAEKFPAAKRYLYLFSKSGFEPSLIEDARQDDTVRLVSIEELFA